MFTPGCLFTPSNYYKALTSVRAWAPPVGLAVKPSFPPQTQRCYSEQLVWSWFPVTQLLSLHRRWLMNE